MRGENRRQLILLAATLAGAMLIFVLLLSWLDPAIGPVLAWDGRKAELAFLNALPPTILFAILVALTRRPAIALPATALLLWGLYTVNHTKVQFLETPLLPADLRILANPGPALTLFEHYVTLDLAMLLLVVAGTLAALLIWLYVRPLPNGRGRLLLATLGVVAALTMTLGTQPWRDVYNGWRLGFEPWDLLISMERVGLVSALLLYQWNAPGGDLPKADHAAAIALLQPHADAIRERLQQRTSAERPDIIIVQSESLFDPALLRGVPEDIFLPNLHRLGTRGQHGDLRVPTFGGGTIRTEFEVLTGAPFASLGGVQYPWLELDAKVYPGITRSLARHGYRTVAIHPNSGAFWNRNAAYAAVGFDRFLDIKAFSDDDIVGLFISDAALTDRILEELDDDGREPRFIFAISMENHGPFDWRPGLDQERWSAYPVPDALNAGGQLWYRNYLYLADDADRELARLAAALETRSRPSVLLFFGDHLPALPPVYIQLGFDDGNDARTQPVPWLLLDSTDPTSGQIDTHSWLLPILLLDAAGLGDDAYFAIISALREQLPLDSNDLDEAQQAGITALARLQLRGELDALLEQLGLRSAPAQQVPTGLNPSR